MPRIHARPRLLLAGSLLSLVSACASPEPTPADPELLGGVITAWTDSTELFMEHPALIVGADGVFAVHLTRVSDFAPVANGPVTFRFTPRDGGEPVVIVQELPRAPGIFGPRPVFPRAGTWDLRIEMDSPDLRDTLVVSALEVLADTASTPIAPDEGDGGVISFLKEQAWKTPGFRTAFATVGRVEEVRELPAMLSPANAGVARITAPIAGIVQAGPNGLPLPGRRVAAGGTLGVLTPLPADGGNLFARARAELREAEAEHQRATRLVAAEAAPARRLEEAVIRLDAARESLNAFGGNATVDGRLMIRSPISGTISETFLLPGARVAAGDHLATVIATDQLWLEVNIPAALVAEVTPRGVISFRIGDDEMRRTGALLALAPAIDRSTRTVTGRWRVDNRAGAIRAGALAVALVPVGTVDSGVVIPRSAVLDDDGRAVAYVQTSGESFERRVLTLGAQGTEQVVVRDGIAAGERVVTGAANQVRLASLSSAVPAHGHEH
jgi:RND family efflux transporter MFP subunit